jgi:hypothetical protein
MSILKVAEVTPSRVKGVVRYLLQARGKREKRDTLEAILSPAALTKKVGEKEPSRRMIQATIRESIKIGLLEESQDKLEVALNPKLKLKDDLSLPSILSGLLLSELENIENHDFAKILAWHLAQDFFEMPGNWQETEQRLRLQIGPDLLELNDVRHGQFEHWSCYLGFSWQNNLASNQVLVIDPTAYLRQNLNNIFENQIGQQIPLGDFISRLGKYCPVFETGEFREAIEQQVELRESNHLSSVTSIALRRLADEDLLKLERLSDTSILVLRDGSEDSRISHVTWLGNNMNGGQS